MFKQKFDTSKAKRPAILGLMLLSTLVLMLLGVPGVLAAGSWQTVNPAGAPPAEVTFTVVVNKPFPSSVDTISNTVEVFDDGHSDPDANPDNNRDDEQTPVETPTAIDLTSFTAQAGVDRITLAWKTGTEADTAGFNLYRAEAEAGPYTEKINLSLIAAQGDPLSGDSYTYDDTNVVEGTTYYYKLADVKTSDGSETLHGPVSAKIPAGGSSSQSVFLPIIIK